MPECLFCRIVGGDIPAEVVFENDHVVAFRDINPVAPVHVLVIPRRHIASLNDVTPEHRETMGEVLMGAREVAIAEGLSERGYRVVFNTNKDAGQVVFHIHAHVLGGRGFEWPPG